MGIHIFSITDYLKKSVSVTGRLSAVHLIQSGRPLIIQVVNLILRGLRMTQPN